MEATQKFNEACVAYLRKKGDRRTVNYNEDAMVAFAVEGFKSKVYRQKYNKGRWSQLKAVKALAEDRGISIEDLIAELGNEQAE